LKKIVLTTLATATLLLTGCSQKIELDIFKKDMQYENALQFTKRGEIVQSLETKTVLTATYLSAVDAKTYKDAEYFLVGIYIPNDDKKSNLLLNPNTKFTLNGQGFQSIEIVKDRSEEYKKFAFLNKWAKYYKVKFKKQETPFLEIKYIDKKSGKIKLKFDNKL
jgi:hypothetical protein